MPVENKKLLEEKNTHLWFEGSPLVLCSVRLVLDIDAGGVFVSAKFMNVQPEAISTAIFDIICYNSFRQPVDRMENCIYTNMEIERNGEFGGDLRFAIKNTQTRSVEFLLKSVSNRKNDVWYNSESVHFNRSIEQKNLYDVQGNLNKRFLDLCTENNIDHTKLVFNPIFADSHWLCACGCLNWTDEQKCFACGNSAEWLKENASVKKLEEKELNIRSEAQRIHDKYDKQLEIDKQKQMEEFRQRTENYNKQLKKQSRSKILKKAILIIAAIALILAAIGTAVYFIKPYIEYTSAVSGMNSGKYDEAMAVFENMGDYMDSQELYKKCLYGKASVEYNNGNMIEAYTMFRELGNYLDSYERYCKSVKRVAERYIDEKNYTSALSLYGELGEEYADNYDELLQKTYEDAQKNLSVKKLSTLERAYDEFIYLGDYKDSSDKAKECLYQEADFYYSRLEYGKSIELYEEIRDYKDTENILSSYEYLQDILSAANKNSAAVWTSSAVECSKCREGTGKWTYEFFLNGVVHIYFSCENDAGHNSEISEKYKIDKNQFYISKYVNGNFTWVKYADIKYVRSNKNIDAGTNTVMSLNLVNGTSEKLELYGNIITDDNITFSSE